MTAAERFDELVLTKPASVYGPRVEFRIGRAVDIGRLRVALDDEVDGVLWLRVGVVGQSYYSVLLERVLLEDAAVPLGSLFEDLYEHASGTRSFEVEPPV